MIKSFVFEPYIGALPIRFEMSLQQVNQLLGEPAARNSRDDGGYHALYAVVKDSSYIKVFFDDKDRVTEVELDAGCQLWFQGEDLLNQRNLIAFLMRYDPHPDTAVGVVVFKELGLSVGTEYEYKDEEEWRQRSIDCFARQAFDSISEKIKFTPYKPDNDKQ